MSKKQEHHVVTYLDDEAWKRFKRKKAELGIIHNSELMRILVYRELKMK